MKLLFKSGLSCMIIFLCFCTTIFSQDFQKCGTFSTETLAKIGLGCDRPLNYATKHEIVSDNFVVHFITVNNPTPPPNQLDYPSDSTTWEYAQKISNYAEHAWNYQCNILGWNIPPGDGACGGYDNKYDIYIKNDISFGYTQPETQISGTNKYTSYIVITNSIIIGNNPPRPLTDKELKVTVAHEFNHALQFGYNGTKPTVHNSWFYENTATWVEEIVYPEINDWITTFLNNPNAYSPLNRPFLPIDHFGNDYQYNGALFCHMLSRWFNNQLIRDIWQYASTSNNPFLFDINNVLVSKGTDLKNALKKYAVWRFYTGARDDGNHFPKGHLYTSSKILREHNTGIGSGSSSPDDLYSRGGTSYIVFKNADGVLNISFNGQDNREFSVIALNRRAYFGDTEHNFTLNTQNDGTIQNLSGIGDDEVVLIPLVTDWQGQLSISSYSYSSNYGQGISTSFWTEKELSNLNGNLTLQRSSLINSGSSKNLANQLDYNVITNQERFLNVGGKTVKHNRWNNFTNKNLLYQQFKARDDNKRQSAKYEDMEYSRIEARLEGSLIPEKGSFEFQDPWYVKSDLTQPGNYWIPCLSSYEPNGKEGATEKGVFLNQGYNPINQTWTPPYYSVGAISPQPIEINGRTHNFYFQTWSANPPGSAEFQDANALQTPVVFKQEGATVQANMKGTQLSNEVNAYANNSQRKLVRTQNGNLHCVYESMEMVWYEKSTDGGVNWSEPKRISNYNSKERSPAMDYINDKIYIVYEEYDEEITALMLCEFEDGGMFDYTEIKQINDINIRYSPVVAANEVNVVVVWKEALSNSLKLKHKYFTGTGWVWSEETTIPNTDINSQSPTIAISKLTMPLQSPNKSYCKLAWVNFDSEEKSSIEFYNIEIVDGSSTIEFKDYAEIALRSGFSRNHSPSIIEFNGGARICWIGERRDEHTSFPEDNRRKTVVFTDPGSTGRYWTFGRDVNSVSINRSNSCYAIAWATDNNNERIHYTDCNTLRDVYSLNIIGKHVQLSNGTTPNTMQALAFNTSNLPYYMQTEQLYADPEPIYVEEKREGVVSEADAQVYFNIGDIEVDGEKVSFVEIPDTVNITSQQTANQYLVSLPFSLTDNSEFFYSVKYGLTDSLAALSMLSGGKSISFKVELLDAQTNEVLGVFDEVTYDQGNLIPYEKIDYQVLTNGIGGRLVKMRLIINSNFTPSYSVAEKYEEPSGLAKKSYKQIGYQGSLAVKEYALEQNYPNPFNPTTTISWQSPVGSHQTLKVFDVLGREVATLVNEWKEAGRYSIEFNASDLASGVYIYQLRINDYVATKKLLMIK